VGGGLADREEPVEFTFGYGIGEPAEQEMRPARKWDFCERDTEGELEDGCRGGVGGGEVEECALDFSATIGEVLGDDEQVGLRIRGKLSRAPECAGGQLGLGVGGVVVAD